MWVLLDNYDSFTYILHHYLLLTGNECLVLRHDAVSVAELAALNPERLIISPGPGTPREAGITLAAIAYFHQKIPILGVCLGHQALGMYFGATLERAHPPKHGEASRIHCLAHPLFEGMGPSFMAGRYHSLHLKSWDGTGLVPLAFSEEDGILQAMVHEQFPCTGVQFHPESILTENGQRLIANWAAMHTPVAR